MDRVRSGSFLWPFWIQAVDQLSGITDPDPERQKKLRIGSDTDRDNFVAIEKICCQLAKYEVNHEKW